MGQRRLVDPDGRRASTVWVRRAGRGHSLGKHHIRSRLLGSTGYSSHLLCGLLVPSIFLPVSGVRNPVQSNVKTPHASNLKRVLS